MNIDAADGLPTWRLWGEERTPGAIFTVYLKKVRYHRPNKSVSEDNISHLEWETVRVRLVKAATLNKLVECLASDEGELETTYVNIFLATYRSFSTASQVLGLLIDRYKLLASDSDEVELPDCIRQLHMKTLILSLHVWLDTYPEDFVDPPKFPALQRLDEFCKENVPESELAVRVNHRLERLLQEVGESSARVPTAVLHNNGDVHEIVDSTKVTDLSEYKFPHINEVLFAEQLTCMDMDLFTRLVPHQCLGSVWARRGEKPGAIGGLAGGAAGSVLATVNQFNAVSLRVISTILVQAIPDRVAIITTWIKIAQELRVLKNFSSLKAIVSGLQSNPIHRLKRTWAGLDKDTYQLFSELARIFSEENNQFAQRELLMREGTAKFANTVGTNDRQLQKAIQRQLNQSGTISHGTIPYLGTFLTDLTMIDTAIPDFVGEQKLINFDKRRREFEILAQIKLLQSAANGYSFKLDLKFEEWFNSIPVLDDKEAYDLSCQLEQAAPSNTLGSADSAKSKKRQGHKKNDSVASTNSGSSSSSFYLNTSHETSWRSSRGLSPSPLSSKSSSTSSLVSLDASLGSTATSGSNAKHQQSLDSSSTTMEPEFYVIKVTTDCQGHAKEGQVMYKSIMLSNNDRTHQVVRQAMLKLGLEGRPDDYSFAQILPQKELFLPHDANVYYAVNTAHDLNFIVRRAKKL
ncbi:ral guanine nucleotide dissociation stimulator isoform X2 [Neocloeon triangulifer]|uniref:ral guanine nucleotide dissociation stimulator isoform X2 n=1 Tax=Neocloeon triangulifer TaxID=2078957 RepID=UPI00286F12AB|nr:ral guanine nucleotide dissociation stimulator isoform X2 [Neocloeon triangulifer]